MFVVMRLALAGAAITAAPACDRVFGLEREVVPLDAPVFDAPSAYAAIVLTDEPVGYFRLGERDGVTAMNVTGGPQGQYVSAFMLGSPGAIANDPDSAVSFGDGPTGVLFGDVFEFADRSRFTLEAWIKPAFDGNFNNIITKWSEPPVDVGYLFYCKDATLSLARTISTQSDLVNWTGLVPGRYTHVAGSYDGTTLRLYANGVEVAQQTSSIMLPDTQVGFVIGAGNGHQFGSPYQGEIDEVAIYDEAVAGPLMFEHYAAGR